MKHFIEIFDNKKIEIDNDFPRKIQQLSTKIFNKEIWQKIGSDIFLDKFCFYRNNIDKIYARNNLLFGITVSSVIDLGGLLYSPFRNPSKLFIVSRKTSQYYDQYFCVKSLNEVTDNKYYKMLISNIDMVGEYYEFGATTLTIDIFTFFKYYNMHGYDFL